MGLVAKCLQCDGDVRLKGSPSRDLVTVSHCRKCIREIKDQQKLAIRLINREIRYESKLRRQPILAEQRRLKHLAYREAQAQQKQQLEALRAYWSPARVVEVDLGN